MSGSKLERDEHGDLLSHEYDGIREYDNPLPRWWVWLFWATFVFAIGYFFYFQMSGVGKSIHEDYAADVTQATKEADERAAKEQVTEESLGKVLANSTSVSAGGAVFAAKCVACHSDKGQGLIGPNLTDDHWIHGQGKLLQIYTTAKDGVLEKGMPAWGRQLSPMELKQVVAFVGSIRWTKVAGKAPEGALVAR